MKKTTWLLRVIGAIQIVLGLFYLFAPDFFLHSMGHSSPEADIYYPLAMLAARFIAYGVAFIYISSDPVQHTLWMTVMIMIQAIDLAAGVFYTVIGIVPIAMSGFPMFNATWMIILLILWMPKRKES